MPDALTPTERALIEKALAAGRVTRCPPRTHALDPTVGLRPKDVSAIQFKAMVRANRLRKAERREEGREEPAPPKPQRAPSPHLLRGLSPEKTARIEARRRAVIAVSDGIRSARDIAALLKPLGYNVSNVTVSHDIHKLKQRGVVVPTPGFGSMSLAQRAAQEKRLAAMRPHRGKLPCEIAALLGRSVQSVKRDIARMRAAGEDWPKFRGEHPTKDHSRKDA